MLKILLVMENAHEAERIADGLVLAGHEAVCVRRLEAALTLVRERRFALAVIDEAVARPGAIEENELLCALRAEAPDLGILLVADGATVGGAVAAMRWGACDYLEAPGDTDALVAAVERALGPAAARGGRPWTAPEGPATAHALTHIVGTSRPIRELKELVAKVADTDSTVLITGETGTGKELVGRAIYESSRRRSRVFCAINSAAFPETLLESELFGHRRGSFTGAATNKRGLFEGADGGTVFLDEVAEMPLSMQAKLLRFLQTGELRPVGSETSRCVDVRLVTATNKDLEREVEEGRFREDLYYRLAVIPLRVPPLRERTGDIPLLANHFLRRFASATGKHIDAIDAEALDWMVRYPWPGNVRQLENAVESGVALCSGSVLRTHDLPAPLRARSESPPPEGLQSLEKLERAHILRTLEHVNWNRKRAAEILQISTTTLWRRLKDFGIDQRAAAGRL
ncbi:MAG: sigma-54 dependent transcriptional regulator [Myxococcota bacterium]|nr:sigma-54 dependent transcriptional regulator [Myxococcota bacterium]